MFCKWCGMESATTNQCSWCHRSLTTANSESPVNGSSKATDASAEAASSIPLVHENADALSPLTAGETAAPKAPWTISPPVPPIVPRPTPPKVGASATSQKGGAAPIIPIKRAGAGRPAPSMPPLRINRSGKADSSPPAPAPTAPPAARPTEAPPGGSPLPSPPLSVAPAAPVGLQASPAAESVAPPLASGGLAEGVAAPRSVPPVETHVPTLGTFQAAKSKYYAGQLIDPLSGAHYDSDTGKATATPLSGTPTEKPADAPKRPTRTMSSISREWEANQLSMKARLARYLGGFAVILALSGWFAYASPSAYVVPLILAQFLGALLLPVMRVVPWADEDADDVWFLLGFLLLGGFVMTCGPVIALIFYAALALLRQNGSPAVFGCLLVAVCARLMVESALGSLKPALFTPFGSFTVQALFVNWSSLVTLLGWYAASVFHKLDE